MIYDLIALNNIYGNYSNINQKISLECKKGTFIRIKKGLYTDNLYVDAPVIANVCYGPSYISFEYALGYYGLIPELVTTFTSTTFNKKNNKLYNVNDIEFEYRSIPNLAYPYEITYLTNDDGIHYKIASREKALCDTLYSKYPVRTITDLKVLLFDDLRIDENEFMKLDFNVIKNLIPLYHSNTLKTLNKLINEVLSNEISIREGNRDI